MTKSDAFDPKGQNEDINIDEPAMTGILKPKEIFDDYEKQADEIVDGITDVDSETKMKQTADVIVDNIAAENPDFERPTAVAEPEAETAVEQPQESDAYEDTDVSPVDFDHEYKEDEEVVDVNAAETTILEKVDEPEDSDGPFINDGNAFEPSTEEPAAYEDDDEFIPAPVVPVMPVEEAAQAEEPKKKKKHTGRNVLIVLIIILMVMIGAACAYLAVDDGNRIKKVPSTTMLDGNTDVSGMTSDELAKTIQSRMDNGLVADVKLTLADQSFSIDLNEVGTVDAQKTVDAAFAPYDKSMPERWLDRIMELTGNKNDTYNVMTVCVPATDKLAAKVTEIAGAVDTEAKNAGYEFDSATRGLKVTPAVQGRKVDIDKTVADIQTEIERVGEKNASSISVTGTVATTEAEKTTSGQGIFVDTSKCVVRLYEEGAEVASYPCTPGMSGYATPKGDWKLSYKDASPTWYNPHSEWAKDMPETIGPGASNPLGLRALAVSCGGGIFLHGTTNTGGLGRPGSHGCVRLSNNNIVELYNRVSAGIPIIIR